MEHDWPAVMDGYVDGVLSDEIVVSPYVRQACERHVSDLARDDIYFDRDSAQWAGDCFAMLRFSDGEYVDQPFLLHPPQAFIVGSLMGWKRPDGLRRFRRAHIDLGRGNGKTPLAAGLALVVGCLEGEPGAESYCVATASHQARDFCWGDSRKFSERSGLCGESGHVKLMANSVVFPKIGGFFKPLSSDPRTADSLRIHFLAVEELHAWRELDREMWDKLMTGCGKRRQTLVCVVTTAGNEQSTIWRGESIYCKSVLEPQSGIEDDTLFPFICEIPEDDDPFDPANWPKSNPLLEYGIVKRDYLETAAKQAKLSYESRVSWLRFHCNQYVQTTSKPITPKIWAIGNQELPDLKGNECRLGLDLGWRVDLSSLAAVWPLDSIEVEGEFKRRYAVKTWSWIPGIETHRDLTMPPWANWVASGDLFVTDSKSTDNRAIFGKILELEKEFWVRSVALDINNAREFAQALIDHRYDEKFVCEFRQNCKAYHEPMSEFLLALGEGRIIHGGDPILGWAAGHLKLHHDASGYGMPDKQKSEEHIDPIVAVVMALSECMYNPSYPSVGIMDVV